MLMLYGDVKRTEKEQEVKRANTRKEKERKIKKSSAHALAIQI